MNLRQLECFVAVAEEGSFTRAAERVGIAQPSLSQHIRALEEELNGAVVTRLPHGAALTPAGRSLLPEARAALRAVERAYRAPRAALALEAGELEIATVLSMAVGLLPGYIGAWHEQYPNVAIRLHEFRHRTLLEDAVEQGVADLAIGPHPVRPWSGPLEIVGWEEFVLVVAAADPLAGALDRPARGARRPGVGALPPRSRPRRDPRVRLPPRRVPPARDGADRHRRRARCGSPRPGSGRRSSRQHRPARRRRRRAAASSRGSLREVAAYSRTEWSPPRGLRRCRARGQRRQAEGRRRHPHLIAGTMAAVRRRSPASRGCAPRRLRRLGHRPRRRRRRAARSTSARRGRPDHRRGHARASRS